MSIYVSPPSQALILRIDFSSDIQSHTESFRSTCALTHADSQT